MPRLGQKLQKSVFFLFGQSPTTTDNVAPGGTGCLIGLSHPKRAPEQHIMRHVYAITCRHVVQDGFSIIRLNTKNGGNRFIELDPSEWIMSDASDAAIIDITDTVNSDDDFCLIPAMWLATNAYIEHAQMGIGEDGFMLGLFTHLPGEKRNVVAARFGHISMLADDDTMIEYVNNMRAPGHIFDMNSRPGFSGSPVFVYRTPEGDLRKVDQGPSAPVPRNFINDAQAFSADTRQYWQNRENTLLCLLGIHARQYQDKVRVFTDRDARDEVDNAIRDGDIISIPNSMAVVVPAEQINALLLHPKIAAQRERRDAKPDDDAEEALMLERSVYSGWSLG